MTSQRERRPSGSEVNSLHEKDAVPAPLTEAMGGRLYGTWGRGANGLRRDPASYGAVVDSVNSQRLRVRARAQRVVGGDRLLEPSVTASLAIAVG